ncbi:uncharacterized protein LOC105696801 [Orussus abietinus]|uniref:uncharacterized protein LOC105696801 n=1 Tax=Orussus abietinus TaxID=222816 RepID=UPI00062647A5|nr:uncharacterized protein LOC105696801 [Orussus abietinus]
MRARCVKNRLGPSSFGLGGIEFAAWIWIGCALFNIVLSQENFYTHGRYGKREEHQQSSLFWSGSRYGRSGATGERNAKSISKAVEVAPRVDRFFFGSRYGKRTLPAISFRTSTPLTRLGAALNYLNQARRAERARHNDGEFPNHDDRTRRMEHLRRELINRQC